jgi:hypothetical protein
MAKLKRGVFILAVVVSLPVLALALMAWRTSCRPAADGPYEGTQAIVRGGDGSFVYVVNSRRGWLTVDRMGRNSTRPVCSFPWAAVVVAGAVAPALFAVDVVKRRRAAGARGFRVVRRDGGDAGAGTS